MVLIEVQTGAYLGEDDIIRYEDVYARGRTRLQEFEAAVARVPEILQCYSLSGEQDYVFEVIARSVRAYEATVKNALTELPNVQSTSTSFTLKRVKASPVVPV